MTCFYCGNETHSGHRPTCPTIRSWSLGDPPLPKPLLGTAHAKAQEGLNLEMKSALDAIRVADVKLTNPKDRIGSSKLPVSLVPDTVLILAAQAFAEGASKYGAYNWRVAGVRLSIYMEAMRRHQMKLWNGEWSDKKTGVPHLASIIACCGIIEDARACGKLTDDRPPILDVEPLIEEAEAVIQHVMAMNSHMNPHHCVITDPVVAA